MSEVSKTDKWVNLLVNSECLYLRADEDHGVSQGCADINACEQTYEGLSKQMFNGENFDTW